MKNGAMAVIGTAAVPSFLARAAWGTATTPANKRLVVIFQRGAADGLNIVIPHAEPAYYAMRPSINIPRQQVIDLNGFFGLHPSLASFKPLWDQGHLAIVHAAGSPDTTRSHFDAQDYMESGTPGVKNTSDGWLNRTLQTEAASRRAVPRRRTRYFAAAHSLGQGAGRCGQQRQRILLSPAAIPRRLRWAIPSKRCMRSRSTPSCTAPAARRLRRCGC